MKEHEELALDYHRREIEDQKYRIRARWGHRRALKHSIRLCVHIIRMHRGEVLHLLDEHRQKIAGRDG